MKLNANVDSDAKCRTSTCYRVRCRAARVECHITKMSSNPSAHGDGIFNLPNEKGGVLIVKMHCSMCVTTSILFLQRVRVRSCDL